MEGCVSVFLCACLHVFLFEARSLSVQPRIASDSQQSYCFSLLHTQITGASHQAQHALVLVLGKSHIVSILIGKSLLRLQRIERSVHTAYLGILMNQIHMEGCQLSSIWKTVKSTELPVPCVCFKICIGLHKEILFQLPCQKYKL